MSGPEARRKAKAEMDVKRLRMRADKIWQNKTYYNKMLRDVYDYVTPMRDVTNLNVSGTSGSGKSEGASRTDKIFDATAPKASFRFAGRLQTELTPIFQNFFSLEAGPMFQGDEDQKKILTTTLQRVGEVVNGVLASGTFHNASHEMYLDLYAGTGAMYMREGDDEEPFDPIVVPLPEVGFETDARGHVTGIDWRKMFRYEELEENWPNATYDKMLLKKIDETPDAEVEVHQYFYRDVASKKWNVVVWTKDCKADSKPFWRETFRVKPWLTPRFFRVPGEAYGRGPANLAMPFIKTLNKAQELVLHAGVFALNGLWMYRRDGIFNPDTARFEPRAMWAVSTTGGPMGPAIQRLEVPKDFDISQIIIADQREAAKMALMDDGLPMETAAVRSATEVAERIARLSQDLAGVYGRLTLEIVVPLVTRVIDILERRGMLGELNIKVDQLFTQVRVVAPIAIGQMAQKIKSHVDALQMALMLGESEARRSFKIEELIIEVARWLGMEERFIHTKEDRDAARQQEQQMAMAQQASEIAKNLPTPSPQDQVGELVNGGAI
jgi:hypothetical protein